MMKREKEDRREMARRTPLDRLCCMSGLLLSIACCVALIHVEFRIQEQQRLITQTATVCDKMENEILQKVQQNYKHWGETRDESWKGNKGRFSCVYALTLESLRNDEGDVNENGIKAMGLDKKNNNFARASRFFVHFSAVTARLQRETG